MEMSPINLAPIPQFGHFCCTSGAVWTHEHKKYWVKVPPFFYTNGASVPNWAWPLLEAEPPRLVVPGLFHDYLVRIGAEVHWESQDMAQPLTSDLAIEIMNDIMYWANVIREDRKLVCTALRVTAWFYWQNKKVDWSPIPTQ
jgi:hypothetical protein